MQYPFAAKLEKKLCAFLLEPFQWNDFRAIKLILVYMC